MPTYVCSAATGRLTSDQKAQIVRSITEIHHEETGAPRYLVQNHACARLVDLLAMVPTIRSRQGDSHCCWQAP